VASLEAKLKTTSKALKDVDAAKTSADKAAKAAEARASKAEKALAKVAKKHATRIGAIVERLDAIVASVGSKFFGLPLYPATLVPINMLLLAYLYFCDAAEQLGEVMKLRLECAKDPLLILSSSSLSFIVDSHDARDVSGLVAGRFAYSNI
jgi:hypothetical protein